MEEQEIAVQAIKPDKQQDEEDREQSEVQTTTEVFYVNHCDGDLSEVGLEIICQKSLKSSVNRFEKEKLKATDY